MPDATMSDEAMSDEAMPDEAMPDEAMPDEAMTSSDPAANSDSAATGSHAAARQLKEESRTANGIYGVIVGTGVMAADNGTTVGRLAVAVLVTLIVYWAAERYAHVVARRIVLRRRLTRAELRRELSDGWELVTASYLPLLVLVTSSLLGADLFGSVRNALVFSALLLGLSGWRVGREAALSLTQGVLSAAIAGAFGVVMIALQTFLH